MAHMLCVWTINPSGENSVLNLQWLRPWTQLVRYWLQKHAWMDTEIIIVLLMSVITQAISTKTTYILSFSCFNNSTCIRKCLYNYLLCLPQKIVFIWTASTFSLLKMDLFKENEENDLQFGFWVTILSNFFLSQQSYDFYTTHCVLSLHSHMSKL